MPFRHQCTISPFCDEDVWFVFDANLGVPNASPARVKACGRHAAVLLRAAFDLQQKRGDEWMSILIEPTKGCFRPYDSSLP